MSGSRGSWGQVVTGVGKPAPQPSSPARTPQASLGGPRPQLLPQKLGRDTDRESCCRQTPGELGSLGVGGRVVGARPRPPWRVWAAPRLPSLPPLVHQVTPKAPLRQKGPIPFGHYVPLLVGNSRVTGGWGAFLGFCVSSGDPAGLREPLWGPVCHAGVGHC